MKALEYGACALIQKPALGTKQYFEESRVMICDAIRSAHQSQGKLRRKMMSPISNSGVGGRAAHPQPKLDVDVMLEKPTKYTVPIDITDKVVVVGASIGGTEALKDFLVTLPDDSPAIVILQHKLISLINF